MTTHEDSMDPAAGGAPTKSTAITNLSRKRKLSSTVTSTQKMPQMDSPKELDREAPYPDPKTTSNLLSRLQSFLPQLQAANQALPNNGVTRDKQVDLDLHSDDSDDDDDDDDDDDEEIGEVAKRSKNYNYIQEVAANDRGQLIPMKAAENDHESGAALPSQSNNDVDTRKQTIEIQFALGDMTGNPLMQLLVDDDDEDDDDNKNHSSSLEQEETLSARESAVANLLSSQEGLNQESNLSINSTARGLNTKKKSLITELIL